MRFKKAFALFLLIAVLPIFAACGTITTKDAGEYSDDVDAYQTEPVPEGKPSPVNTEDQEIDKTKADIMPGILINFSKISQTNNGFEHTEFFLLN